MRIMFLLIVVTLICSCENKVLPPEKIADDFLAESLLRIGEGGILTNLHKSYYIYRFYDDYNGYINREYVLTVKELDSIAIISQKTLFYQTRVGCGLSRFVDSAIIETSQIVSANDIVWLKAEIAAIINDSSNYLPPKEINAAMSNLVLFDDRKISFFSVKNLGYKKMKGIDSIFLSSNKLFVLDSNIVNAARHFRRLSH